MFQPLRKRRLSQLTKIGFVIPERKKDTGQASDRIDAFLRHPLTLLVAGFFLTAVIGGGFSYLREKRDSLEAARVSQALAYRTAIDQFSRNVAMWKVQSQVLYAAIDNRFSMQEVAAIKSKNDEKYAEILGSEEKIYALITSIVEPLDKTDGSVTDAVTDAFRKFRVFVDDANICLNKEYAEFQKNPDHSIQLCEYESPEYHVEDPVESGGFHFPRPKPEKSPISDLITTVASCGNSIVRELRPFDLDNTSHLKTTIELSSRFKHLLGVSDSFSSSCSIADNAR
jgi:hypothetical protein